jgi:hypothetical protein
MRTVAVTLLTCAALAGQAQQGKSSYEAVTRDILDATEKLTTILATVKDEASSTEARPALKKAVEHFLEVRTRATALPQPSREERDRVASAYRKKLAEAVSRFLQERNRVAALPATRDVLRELAPLQERKTGSPRPEEKAPTG